VMYRRRARPANAGAPENQPMQPVYIDDCLAWYHPAKLRNGSIAVVLCPALGREARWTYCSLRHLAVRLAAAGLPTVRFDYLGTGDSAEPTAGPLSVEAWRDGVQAVADWVRAETGLASVAFGGIRFGALIAADAATRRSDVAALALIAPVLSGRAYARELRLSAIGGENDAAPEDGIELDGVMLSNAALAEIGRLDPLRPAGAPAPHLLVMTEDQRAAPFVGAMMERGVAATVTGLPGQVDMLRVSTSNRSPQAALDEATDWLCGVGRASLAGGKTAVTMPPVRSELAARGWREQPLLFGSGNRLAGILCTPDSPAASRQAVLIVNTGGDPRAGIGRFGVRMARGLAEAGIASLRLDFGGLGDSRLPGDTGGHLYEVDRGDDIRAGLDRLQAGGYRQLGSFGICTGAYHLLHAAADDRRIRWMGLMNLVTFEWRPGDVLEVAQRSLGRSNARYRELAAKPETWRRLVRGQIDVRHLTATMRRRVLASAARTVAAPLQSFGMTAGLDRPRRLLLPLLRRGTRVLAMFGFDDPGVATLEAAFGGGGRRLARLPGASVRIERQLDHTLSRVDMQLRVIRIVIDDLTRATGA
jgi:alpha/beta superfamily hydrolase